MRVVVKELWMVLSDGMPDTIINRPLLYGYTHVVMH